MDAVTTRDSDSLTLRRARHVDVEAVEKPKPHHALALYLNPPYPFTPPSSPTALPKTSPHQSPQTATPVPRIQHNPLYHPPRILPDKVADMPEIRRGNANKSLVS